MSRLVRWLRFNWMYLGRPPWDTGVSPPELLEAIRQLPAGRALDLGCGTGTNLVTLAQAGWQVTGVDYAVRAVRDARRKLRKAGLPGEVRAGDVSRLETVHGCYDLVLDIGCYHGLVEASRPAYRQNLPRILAPGGTFLLYTHWKQEGPIGITAEDLAAFQALLALQDRQDSTDRSERPVSWLRFTIGGLEV